MPEQIKKDVIAAIGNTPLIRLRQASEATGCEILGKAEFLNPGQSVKDRAALFIIQDAVRRGALRPGGTIVEGTFTGGVIRERPVTAEFLRTLGAKSIGKASLDTYLKQFEDAKKGSAGNPSQPAAAGK